MNTVLFDNNLQENKSNYLQANLKFLINKYKIDNAALAKCTGLTTSTIAGLRSRNTNPTISTLYPLAEFFNLTIDQLVYQQCDTLDKTNTISHSNNFDVPLINANDLKTIKNIADLKLCLNKNNEQHDQDYVTISHEKADTVINNYCFAVKLDTEILAPVYSKDTLFILDPYKNPRDSNIVLLSIDDKSPAFRQVFIDSDTLYFKPINPEYGSMQVYQNYTILGVAIRAIYDVDLR